MNEPISEVDKLHESFETEEKKIFAWKSGPNYVFLLIAGDIFDDGCVMSKTRNLLDMNWNV